jgi:hypothetical protein
MAGHCDVVEPELVEVRPGRFVACHLYSAVEQAEGLAASAPTEE